MALSICKKCRRQPVGVSAKGSQRWRGRDGRQPQRNKRVGLNLYQIDELGIQIRD